MGGDAAVPVSIWISPVHYYLIKVKTALHHAPHVLLLPALIVTVCPSCGDDYRLHKDIIIVLRQEEGDLFNPRKCKKNTEVLRCFKMIVLQSWWTLVTRRRCRILMSLIGKWAPTQFPDHLSFYQVSLLPDFILNVLRSARYDGFSPGKLSNIKKRC